jgi:hypothetical protein
MLTTLELVGLLILVAVILAAAFLLQRLDRSLAGEGEEAVVDPAASAPGRSTVEQPHEAMHEQTNQPRKHRRRRS